MIVLLHYGRHTVTHRKIEGMPGLPPLRRRSYQWLLRQHRLPRGSYIFTDRERMDPWELRIYAAAYRHLNSSGPAYRAINDPARMQDRAGLLRKLYTEGCNDFDVYRVAERKWPRHYPVFIRRQFDHYLPLSKLLQNESELRAALLQLRNSGEPEDGLLIVEYCAEPVAGKLFRKLSSYRIGDRLFFHSTVHEENWLVKYGTQNSASNELYREEQQMIEGNAYSAELSRAFDLGEIDYGRADFGLVEGKVQVYEINTNPTIVPRTAHPNRIRVSNMAKGWELYCEALSALDTTNPAGPRAEPFSHPELTQSRWQSLRYGTRFLR